MSRNRRVGEPSVDRLIVSYRTRAVWALDDHRRTRGSWTQRFLGAFGPCNDQTSWVSYDWISSWDTEVGWRILIILRPGGHFLGNPWVLDPEGLHSAILGEATVGTCWGIAFFRSEAGHYRCQALLLFTSGEAGYYKVLPDFFTCSRAIIPPVPGVLGSIDGILGLAQTHSYLMSHTRFVFTWSYHFSLRVGQDRRSLGPDPARLPL
ncbi:hypothetical protein F2Q69_00013819 [Brassica cretica]|uniref:Uncharacterized protein n=1 Tax=Brassica cretica TaxID=69181 RepID=A0A8S9QRR3_BRACR|nr:hypothetical protein F2Q69_00013819 [Brassica cretica]